jgi:hypothetical protein
MPLARIITRNSQSTIAASEYLRSRGYIVETVSPDDFRVTPAEFELNLEKCGPGEALARAKARLEAPQEAAAAPTEAHAAPPQENQKAKVPVAYDIAGRPVQFADEEEILPERRRKPNSILSALVAMFARGKRGVGSGLAGAWNSVSRPVAEFRRERAEQRALKLEAELAQEREEVRYQEELARERLRQEMERQREQVELAERQRQERIAAEKLAEERRRIAAEKASAEERERQRIESERTAALAAQQEQAWRIEAERQAAELRAQQEATVAAERQAVQQQATGEMSPEGIGSTSVSAMLPRPVEPALPQKPAASDYAARHQLPRRRGLEPFVLRRPRAPIAISRKAVLTGLGASLLVLLGFVAFANRRPASPLSPGALMKNQSVKQDTPFGAATISPAPVTTAKPRAAAAPAKTSPAVRSTTQKPRSTRRTARHLRRQSEDDSVAEDEVVVRHLQSPRPKPQPTASNAKLKQYSDME